MTFVISLFSIILKGFLRLNLMRKLIISLVLILAVLLSACALQSSSQDGSSTTEQTKITGGPLVENLRVGTPTDLPAGLDLYQEVNAESVHTDLSINSGKNFFYTTGAERAQVYKFYQDGLAATGWETILADEGDAKSILEVKKDGKRLNVFIYDKVPSYYPVELALQGRLVSILYDFATPPLP
jgi:hypothetical protein